MGPYAESFPELVANLPSSPSMDPLADLHAAAEAMGVPAVRPLFELVPLTRSNIAVLREQTRILEAQRIKELKTPETSPTHKPSRKGLFRDKLSAVAKKIRKEFNESDHEGEAAEAVLQTVTRPGSARIVEIPQRRTLVNETLRNVPARLPESVAAERHQSTAAELDSIHPPEIQRWLDARTYKPQPRVPNPEPAIRALPPASVPALVRSPAAVLAPIPESTQSPCPAPPALPAPPYDPFSHMLDTSPTIPDTARDDPPIHPTSTALQRWRNVKKHFDRKKGVANSDDRALLNRIPVHAAYQGLTTEQNRIMAVHLLNGVERGTARQLAIEGKEILP